jgi:hypothetical protein
MSAYRPSGRHRRVRVVLPGGRPRGRRSPATPARRCCCARAYHPMSRARAGGARARSAARPTGAGSDPAEDVLRDAASGPADRGRGRRDLAVEGDPSTSSRARQGPRRSTSSSSATAGLNSLAGPPARLGARPTSATARLRRAHRPHHRRAEAVTPTAAVVSRAPGRGRAGPRRPRPRRRLRATRWSGTGTPVLLLHGLASSRRFWDLVVPGLAGLPLLASTSAATATASGPRVRTTATRRRRRADRPRRRRPVPRRRRRPLLGRDDGAAPGRRRSRAGAGRGVRRRAARQRPRRVREPRGRPADAHPAAHRAAAGRAAGAGAAGALRPLVERGGGGGALLPLFAVGTGRPGAGPPALRGAHADRRRPAGRRPRGDAGAVRCPRGSCRASRSAAATTPGRPARRRRSSGRPHCWPPRGSCGGPGAVHDVPLQWPALVAGLVRAAADEVAAAAAGAGTAA